MKYVFITQHKKTWPVSLLCKVMGVYRNGYYHYMNYKLRHANKEHEAILETIRKIAVTSKCSYGSRRMKTALNVLGYPLSRRKTVRLMKEAGAGTVALLSEQACSPAGYIELYCHVLIIDCIQHWITRVRINMKLK